MRDGAGSVSPAGLVPGSYVSSYDADGNFRLSRVASAAEMEELGLCMVQDCNVCGGPTIPMVEREPTPTWLADAEAEQFKLNAYRRSVEAFIKAQPLVKFYAGPKPATASEVVDREPFYKAHVGSAWLSPRLRNEMLDQFLDNDRHLDARGMPTDPLNRPAPVVKAAQECDGMTYAQGMPRQPAGLPWEDCGLAVQMQRRRNPESGAYEFRTKPQE